MRTCSNCIHYRVCRARIEVMDALDYFNATKPYGPLPFWEEEPVGKALYAALGEHCADFAPTPEEAPNEQ